MLRYLVLGATYAFAAALQPGQLQAYLLSQTMTQGWRRTLPAALAPLLSDVPIVCVVLLVLTRVPSPFVHGLRVAGGCFLLFLAATAARAIRRPATVPARPARVQRTVVRAALVNLLNPNPYLGWALVMGPLLIQGVRERPVNGIALVVAFYATMILALAGLIALFGGARTLGPRVARVLAGVSATALAAFGAYQLWSGATALIRSFTHPV